MPSLKDIRRRIKSVRNTQKITKAMKLVAAAKFARANAAIVAARPYGAAFDAMVARLISVVGEEISSPLLEQREEKKALVALLATDRGFCGSLNSNLFKQSAAFLNGKRESGVEIELWPLGKRAKLYAAKTRFRQLEAREKVLERPNYQLAKEIADRLIKAFTDEGYDRVYIAFVEFRSALSQAPKMLQVLPVPSVAEGAAASKAQIQPDIIIEPAAKEMLASLLRRQVASRIFRSLLEGAASEHGARMTAMDSASNNASKVLKRINLQYARARQAAITKELIEITSGANAL